MRTSDSRPIAIYILLIAGLASLLMGLYGLSGPRRPPVEDIVMRVGSPAGLVLLALSMLMRPSNAARFLLFTSIAFLVAVLIVNVRQLLA